LKIEEVGQLMRDLGGYTGNLTTVGAFRLMWLTLCRPSEAVEATWPEFDLDAGIWNIGAGRMKMREEHSVPLPTQAVEMLRALKSVSGKWNHVFPNRDDRQRPMTLPTLRQALKTLGWAGRYSPHATRTTGSTRLHDLGFPTDWIERQLAHKDPNTVRRTYNHAQYFDDRREMMQHWANLLGALETGSNVLVANFRRSAA
jgi:integrase